MKIKGIQVGFTLLLVLLISCSNKNQDYAAIVADEYEISVQELRKYHEDLFFGMRFPDSEYKGFGEALEELVTKKLKQLDFVNLGLNRDPDLMKGIQRVINEELIVEYFDKVYLGKYITDEVISDYYEGLGKEVSYQQIVLNKNRSNTDEQNLALKEKAVEIKELAEAAGNFSELVEKFSEDRNTNQKEGRMPVLNWKLSTRTPANQIIFRMPEGTIRVIETTNRFRIVKVNEVKDIELKPLEEIRGELFENLREVYSERGFREYDRDKAKLLDKNQYVWNSDGMRQLVSWSRIDGFYSQDKYKETLSKAIEEGNNFKILEYENGVLDLEKYLYLLNNILTVNVSQNVVADDLKQFIDEALRTELIVQKAKDMGLDSNILSMNTDSDVILSEYEILYDEKFIFSKVPEMNKQNLESFYEETKDTLFYQPDKVNIYAKEYTSKTEAVSAVDKLESGIEFEDLFNGWLVKSYYITKQGNIESYMSNEPPYFGKEAFQLSEGETTGPVEFEENGETKYAVIKAANVQTEHIQQLSDVHPRILKRIYDTYYFNTYSEEIANKLRNKYSVEINTALLAELAASQGQ